MSEDPIRAISYYVTPQARQPESLVVESKKKGPINYSDKLQRYSPTCQEFLTISDLRQKLDKIKVLRAVNDRKAQRKGSRNGPSQRKQSVVLRSAFDDSELKHPVQALHLVLLAQTMVHESSADSV